MSNSTEKDVMFLGLSVCPSVSLSVRVDYLKSYKRILIIFFGGVERGLSNSDLGFGGDLDDDPDFGLF